MRLSIIATKNRLHCLFLSALLGIAACSDAQAHDRLVLLTEENPPFNFTDPATGKLTGLAGDLVPILMQRAGIAYDLEILPWNRAYQRVQTEPGICVFAANVTPERLSLFKWVRPLIDGDWVLFARAEDQTDYRGLDDVKGRLVGVLTAAPINDYLIQRQIQTINVAPHSGFTLLDTHRLDLIAAGRHVGNMIAKETAIPIRIAMVLTEADLGMACHPDTSDTIIRKLNETLATLREDGTVAGIITRYDPTKSEAK